MTRDPTPPSIGTMPFDSLLGALAKRSPAPGGGAAAGIVGASAAALTGMVVSYSIGRKSLAEYQPFLIDAGNRLERARSMFVMLADEDACAYSRLNALMKLPGDHPDRLADWEDTVRNAITPPRTTLAAANDLLRLCEDLLGKTNPYLNSDLAVAAIQAEAAARSAAWNVKINVPSLPENQRHAMLAETDLMIEDAKARAARVETGCA
ncbi:MAG: cyclodeaminase/cyclohydrolase family protein [Phycisphaerales bacterium]